MTLRVLLAHQTGAMGGGAISMFQVAEALQQSSDFSPYMLFSAEGRASERARLKGFPAFVYPTANFLYFAHVPFRPQVLLRFFLDILPALRHVGRLIEEQRIDLVYINSSSGFGVALAAWLHRVPIIWHVREVLCNSSVLGRIMICTISRLAKIVVANSDYTASAFGDLEKIKRVYNAVDLAEFSHAVEYGERFRQELGIAPSTPLIGLVSVVSRAKGHEVVLEAFPRVLARIPPTLCLIVGDSTTPAGYENSWRAKLRRLVGQEFTTLNGFKGKVAQLGLEDHLRFVGWRSDIAAVMGALDILVFPSIYSEGFGRPLVEAGAAGKPVIASDIGPAREIVVHGGTGLLVPPADSGALADAVITLLTDKEWAEIMGKAGQQRAGELFALSEYLQSMLQIFRDARDN